MSPRIQAAKTLVRIIKDNAYSNIELSGEQSRKDLTGADNALYQAIVKTSLERKNTLDFIISLFVKSKPDIVSRCLLYVGLSQLLYMDKIPDMAACDETVKAAKVLTGQNRAGFINGVLRNITRQREYIETEIQKADDTVKYSLHPSIVSLIKNQYDNHEDILKSTFRKPPLCIRVNTLITDAVSLKKLFDENDIKSEMAEGCLFVTEGTGKAVETADTGLYYIQGFPSQYAVSLLNAKPGDTVADVCAAPGGKIIGACINMQNTGRAVAFDIHPNKLSLIEKTAKTLGITIIETSPHDSRVPKENLIGITDGVICDVPCSSLGVISSKPEIRYKDISNLSDLYKTQAEILAASAEYVRPGGVLVYSTCTVNNAENRNQVDLFLEKHKNFALESQRLFVNEKGYFEGFYAARLVRTC